jgi:hypothetical protein
MVVVGALVVCGVLWYRTEAEADSAEWHEPHEVGLSRFAQHHSQNPIYIWFMASLFLQGNTSSASASENALKGPMVR